MKKTLIVLLTLGLSCLTLITPLYATNSKPKEIEAAKAIEAIKVTDAAKATDAAKEIDSVEKTHPLEETDAVKVIGNDVYVHVGPSNSYPVVAMVNNGDILALEGAIDNWYIVSLPDGTVGLIPMETAKNTDASKDDTKDPYTMETGKNETQALFNTINEIRKANDLPPFLWDEKLNKAAALKATDMDKNHYLDHYSPVYGTPFTMLKDMGVPYKHASENIVATTSIEEALEISMDVPSNKMNTLSSEYDKMGIAIIDSDEYGKIIVEVFTS